MDSLTQAALGALVGERVLGKQLGRKAIVWGALVGTLPDLDVIANRWLDPIAQLYWHRGLSHSILGVALGVPILTWMLCRWWNRGNARARRPDAEPIGWRRVGVFVFLNFFTHILIDCFTVYGTQILEPFSSRRFGFNNFFIIDPLFTLPMLVWIAAALFCRKQPGRASPAWAWACGLFMASYLGFSFGAQAMGKERFRRELAAAGIKPIRGEVSAGPFTTLVWRGLFETEDAFWIGYWAVNDSGEPLEFYRVPKRLDLLEPHHGDRAVDCALWFSEGYLLVSAAKDGPGFVVTDLRFGEFWPDTGDGLPRTFFTWKVIPKANMHRVSTFEMDQGSTDDIGPIFKRMINGVAARIQGNRRALGPPIFRNEQSEN